MFDDTIVLHNDKNTNSNIIALCERTHPTELKCHRNITTVRISFLFLTALSSPSTPQCCAIRKPNASWASHSVIISFSFLLPPIRANWVWWAQITYLDHHQTLVTSRAHRNFTRQLQRSKPTFFQKEFFFCPLCRLCTNHSCAPNGTKPRSTVISQLKKKKKKKTWQARVTSWTQKTPKALPNSVLRLWTHFHRETCPKNKHAFSVCTPWQLQN